MAVVKLFEGGRPPAEVLRPDLIHEANHRISNHLSLLVGMIEVQASGVAQGPPLLSRDNVRALLRETAGRIASVGDLHRRLAGEPDSNRIDICGYLIENCAALVSTLSLKGRVGIVQRFDSKCMVNAEQAQAIGLIVNEIVTNAVKHAHPSNIPVQMSLGCSRNERDELTIHIDDDGVGLPEGFDPHVDGGVGFKLIRSLADKINANLQIESDSLGLCFRLQLPAQA